jgi:hypothetical protein
VRIASKRSAEILVRDKPANQPFNALMHLCPPVDGPADRARTDVIPCIDGAMPRPRRVYGFRINSQISRPNPFGARRHVTVRG